jgi:putative transposase
MASSQRKQMRRRGERGEARFLTFSCSEGRHFLATRIVQRAIVKTLDDLVAQGAFTLHAWVVMGNHVHLLLTPETQSVVLSLSILKMEAARAVIAPRDGSHQIWERGGGFDRLVWSDQAYWNIFTYIHFNPVKAGLASTPLDWLWSSARDWLRMRRYTPPVQHPVWLL